MKKQLDQNLKGCENKARNGGLAPFSKDLVDCLQFF